MSRTKMARPETPPTMPKVVLDPRFPLEEGLAGPVPVDVVPELESVSLGNGEEGVVFKSVVSVVRL